MRVGRGGFRVRDTGRRVWALARIADRGLDAFIGRPPAFRLHMSARRLPVDEHRAFLEAVLPHLDAIWSVARRMAQRESAVEDLVQETYLRAFRAFAGQGTGEIRSWLVAICMNVARSEYRRSVRRPFEQQLDGEPAIRLPVDDVEQLALAAVTRSAVATALSELPDAQRTAVVLVDLGGLSAREAAELLGAPRGTILARVHRGRRHLAALLEREGLGHAL